MFLIFCAFLILPVLGETKYIAGSPQLSATVSGINEFTPGNEEQLTVEIKNTGLNEFKFVQPGIVEPDDLPNTAKFVTVSLQPDDAPS